MNEVPNNGACTSMSVYQIVAVWLCVVGILNLLFVCFIFHSSDIINLPVLVSTLLAGDNIQVSRSLFNNYDEN
jgi:hypothetical protein